MNVKKYPSVYTSLYLGIDTTYVTEQTKTKLREAFLNYHGNTWPKYIV